MPFVAEITFEVKMMAFPSAVIMCIPKEKTFELILHTTVTMFPPVAWPDELQRKSNNC